MTLAFVAFAATLGPQTSCPPRSYVVYSNAFIHQETGDLLGYELAVPPTQASKAFFYMYEGGLSGPVEVTVTSRKGRLLADSDYVEQSRLSDGTPAPETHHVKFSLIHSGRQLRGTLKVDVAAVEKVRLHRVPYAWGCKNGSRDHV